MSTDFDASKALSYGIRVRFRNENGGVQSPKQTEVQSPVVSCSRCFAPTMRHCLADKLLYSTVLYGWATLCIHRQPHDTVCRSLAMSEGTVVVRV